MDNIFSVCCEWRFGVDNYNGDNGVGMYYRETVINLEFVIHKQVQLGDKEGLFQFVTIFRESIHLCFRDLLPFLFDVGDCQSQRRESQCGAVPAFECTDAYCWQAPPFVILTSVSSLVCIIFILHSGVQGQWYYAWGLGKLSFTYLLPELLPLSITVATSKFVTLNWNELNVYSKSIPVSWVCKIASLINGGNQVRGNGSIPDSLYILVEEG